MTCRRGQSALASRVVDPGDVQASADVFSDIDEPFVRPHPLTESEARLIASHVGKDASAILADGPRPVAVRIVRVRYHRVAAAASAASCRTSLGRSVTLNSCSRPPLGTWF